MEYEHLLLERCDPDQLTEIIDGSSMRHRVLPGGLMTVDAERLSIGSSALHRGLYGMGILVDGAWPRDRITVGLFLDSPADATTNGRVCPRMSLQLFGEGCELNYRALPRSHWFAYCVERDQIQRAALALHGRLLPIPVAGRCVIVQPDPLSVRRIAALMRGIFAAAAEEHSGAATPELTAARVQLDYALSNALHHCGHSRRPDDARHVVQRRRVMARAEEYLRDNPCKPFSLRGLAEAAGISERMLEYHFRRIYGVTPQTWYRSMKLDAVRHDLQQARATGERVGEVAVRWGFPHLGRFSGEYRRLFDELPRDTLRHQS